MQREVDIAHRDRVRRAIDPSVSVVLDALRFCLALAVAAFHWTQPNFQNLFADRTWIGVASVGGFFVLSGFTIRMVTPAGSFVFGRYAIERLSRLWSVALPALAITWVLDFLSYGINPDYYGLYWGPYHYAGLHLLTNALFLSQNWGLDVSPLSNSPFWSLSYEAWFYLLFGLFMARRMVWVFVAAVIAGPNIVYLMLLWMMGVKSFDIFNRAQTKRQLIVLAVSSGLMTILLLAIYVGKYDSIESVYSILQREYFGAFHIRPRRAQIELVIPGLIFVPLFMNLIGVVKLVATATAIPPSLIRIGRAAGDFTFPLYLLHFPIFVFCGAIGFYDRSSYAQILAVFLGVCSVIALFTPLTSVFKKVLKNVLIQAIAFLQQGKRDIARRRLRLGLEKN